MPRLVPPARGPRKRGGSGLGRKPAQSWQPGESRLFMELACRDTDLKNLALFSNFFPPSTGFGQRSRGLLPAVWYQQ